MSRSPEEQRGQKTAYLSLGVPLLLVIVSGIKVLSGSMGWWMEYAQALPRVPFPLFLDLTFVLVFGGSAAFLLLGSRRDRRAFPLGVCFALITTSFSFRTFDLASQANQLPGGLLVLGRIQPEAFFPFFLWRFFGVFPRVRSLKRSRIGTVGQTASLTLGALLFLSNLTLLFPWGTVASNTSVLDRYDPTGLYWLILFGLALPAVPFGYLRARRASPQERRRTDVLVFGLVAGSLPILLMVLGTTVSSTFFSLISSPPWFQLSQAVVYPALLSVPAMTVFAVLSRGALDIRLVIRQAIRYAFARYSIATATAVPFLVLLGLLYTHRDQTLASVVGGGSGLFLLLAGGAGAMALRFRRRAFDAIDRRFFRERYDARTILSGLVHGVRDSKTVSDLARLLSHRIDAALHPRFTFVLILNPRSGRFESARQEMPPLPEGSAISRALVEEGRPVSMVPDGPPSLAGLKGWERYWILDSDAHLIVPLLDGDRQLLGLLLLGQKASELPFTGEDLDLLSDIAASASETLRGRLLPRLAERLELADTPSSAVLPVSHAAEEPASARECVQCGQLGPHEILECPVCGGRMEEALVPLVLRGVFRMERRIGRGGMGIVYRARDLALGRPVAVKTLIRSDSSLARRLRGEARAMASVTHPNLATIYGAESWKGLPTLLVEYLPGGTLAHRLEKAHQKVADTLRVGVALAEGVACLHDTGILHRDIKPSNIGFGASGEPKLLDFGLASLLDPMLHDGTVGGGGMEESSTGLADLQGTRTATGRVRGTLPYLSPEALSGDSPGIDGDLWSLAVVLYESIAGKNPFQKPGGAARTAAPDIREFRPSCPEGAAEFFRWTLSPSRSERPSNVREVRRRLYDLLASAEASA